MDIQTNLFDYLYDSYKITKPIRLIECFAGYGSQALSLKYLGVKFEHHKICEWATKSIQGYKDAHFTNDNTNYSKDLTQEQVIDYLFKKGVSMNYNEPMSYEQIKRKGEEWQRTTYNNIIATHNLVNISQVKGQDLEITDTDKYDYILTYSFPCQDLSLAGKRAGMEKDSGTRSGLLWEVERILDECKTLGNLPKILLMENVPEVVGTGNIEHFKKWRDKLEQLGYSNYDKILNAKNYGIPQNRRRCFMISILGEYNYYFPTPIPLKIRLKDLLEKNVDEKYFLSDKIIDFFYKNSKKNEEVGNGFRFKPINHEEVTIAKTITTRASGRMDDNFICVPEATKKGYAEAYEGDSVNLEQPNSKTRRGRVGKEVAQTLLTGCQQGVVVKSKYELSDDMKKYIVSSNEKYKVNPNNLKLNRDIACTKSTREGCTRADSSDYVAADLPTNYQLAINQDLSNLRIRKLTPKECWRLMGVKDEDFSNVAKNQSDASLYHLAGDPIVVNVLMGIFKQFL